MPASAVRGGCSRGLLALATTIAIALGGKIAPAPALAADTYQYDTLDRLTHVAHDDGSFCSYAYDNVGNILSIVCSAAVGGVPGGPPAPLRFALEPIAPNPAAGERTIGFSIPARGRAQLRVFDAAGRAVAKPFDDELPAGRYSARLAAQGWGPGTYFVRLSFAGRTLRARMIVLR